MAAYTINAANVRMSATGQGGLVLAGQDILAGRPVYLNTTLQQYMLANSLITNAPAGVAASSCNTNQFFQICTRDVNFSCGYTINASETAILGNAAGQINPITDVGSGWYVNILGVGIGGNNVNFQIVGANSAHA